jgi:predicted GNAT family acetyltransferase
MEPEVSVNRTQDGGEFYITVEGKKATLTFSLRGKELVADATYTPPELRGRGIAARLVEAAIDYSRKNGLNIYPMCSYVVEYFKRRPELRSLLSDGYPH